MILVKVNADAKGITGVKISGHSTYAPVGKDIVCAAVSTITQGTVLALEEVVEADIHYEMFDGYLKLELIERDLKKFEQSQILLKAMVLTLQNIELSYPDHIRQTN